MPKRPILALALALSAAAAQADVVVIVNPKSGTASLTADQVSTLFLGKASSLPGGLSQAVDLPEGHAARELFYAKATGKNASQVKAIWARLAFSGKATPPKELKDAAEAKKFVAANPDAIAYIEKTAVDGTVKVVLTVE